MSFDQIFTLMRRHLVAVTLVFALAAGMAWKIKTTPPVYVETANVIFTAPDTNPYSSFTNALITTADVMTRTMLNSDYQRLVREAGGTADFDLQLVNLYNEQFPYYGVPYVTLTTASLDPVNAHRTFTIVALAFQGLISARQAQAGVPPVSRITTHLVADTGPIAQVGSTKRALAGLVVLAIVTAFMVAIFLDRHPVRRRRVLVRSSSSARARTAAG